MTFTVKERNISLDLIKIIAMLTVIMTHVSANIMIQSDTSTIEFLVGNVYNSISRIGVPLFVMTSGALLLDKNKDITINQIFSKYVKNIALLLVFWSAVYSIIFNILIPSYYGDAISIKKVVSAFILGHSHLWYLYMLIGLYLITPFLRMFVTYERKNLVLLFISISLISQFTIPVLNELADIRSEFTILVELLNKFELHFFSGYVTYYLTGWYITHIKISDKLKKVINIFWVPALIITIFYVQFTGEYSNAYSNTNIFIFIYSIGAFNVLYSIPCNLLSDKFKNKIIFLSKLSFGVYLSHQIVLRMLIIVPYKGMPFLYILLLIIGTFVITFLGCFIASKIPVIKRLIRM